MIGSVLLLAGCASVPDAVNPVEWYKDVKGVVTGDKKADSKSDGKPEKRLVAGRNKPAPGADDPTPNLSTVPQRPNTSSQAERRRIERGLVAARVDARQYSREVIRRQGEKDNSSGVPEPRAMPTPAPASIGVQRKNCSSRPNDRKTDGIKTTTRSSAQARPVPNRSKQIRPSVVVPNRNPNPPKLAMAQNIRTPVRNRGFNKLW